MKTIFHFNIPTFAGPLKKITEKISDTEHTLRPLKDMVALVSIKSSDGKPCLEYNM